MYRPWKPSVTSWKTDAGRVYSVGFAKPRVPLCVDCARVQMPSHAGELALVPPTGSCLPLTITAYPEAGSASRLTSGVPRLTPRNWPPAFACHAGMGSEVGG